VAEQRAVENHPVFHDWYKATDYVVQKNSRGRPIEVKRVEECLNCPTQRITSIDTNVWEKKGHSYYKYDKDTVIERISKQEHLRQTFLSNSDLPEDIKQLLAAMRIAGV
jgi:hypothetical protein